MSDLWNRLRCLGSRWTRQWWLFQLFQIHITWFLDSARGLPHQRIRVTCIGYPDRLSFWFWLAWLWLDARGYKGANCYLLFTLLLVINLMIVQAINANRLWSECSFTQNFYFSIFIHAMSWNTWSAGCVGLYPFNAGILAKITYNPEDKVAFLHLWPK